MIYNTFFGSVYHISTFCFSREILHFMHCCFLILIDSYYVWFIQRLQIKKERSRKGKRNILEAFYNMSGCARHIINTHCFILLF